MVLYALADNHMQQLSYVTMWSFVSYNNNFKFFNIESIWALLFTYGDDHNAFNIDLLCLAAYAL